MSQPSPLVLVAVAAGGLLLFARARAARATAAPVSAQKTADYLNPVQWAGMLAGAVVGLTKNIATQAPAGVFATSHPIVAGTPESGLAGWELYTSGLAGAGSVSGDPYNSGEGWTSPSSSAVRPAANTYGANVDSTVAAPVYSVGSDFINNPLGLSFGTGSWLGGSAN